MDRLDRVNCNNKEFVLLSIEGYKKLANIDQTGQDLYWTVDKDKEVPVKLKLNDSEISEILFPKTIPQCLLENARNYPDDP